MLKTQGAGHAARLKDYLREVAFTPEGVRDRFQTDLLAGRHQENLPLLLYRTREPDASERAGSLVRRRRAGCPGGCKPIHPAGYLDSYWGIAACSP